MDHRRFDHLARSLGARVSRRGVIALAGGAATAALAGDDALAARATCRANGGSCTRNAQCCSTLCATGRDVPRARRNRCICPADTLVCGATCCPAGSACIDGACVTTCDLGGDSMLCLLSARKIVQIRPCGNVAVVDTPGICIDDTDCPRHIVTPPGMTLENYGCMVSYRDGNAVHRELAGHCMGWAVGPEVCDPPPPPV